MEKKKKLRGLRIRTGELEQNQKNKETCSLKYSMRGFIRSQLQVLFASCSL